MAEIPIKMEALQQKELDLNRVIEQYHSAASEFVKGNPEPYKQLFSQKRDVTLGNPFGPFQRGWKDVSATMERAATLYREGEMVKFENIARYITSDLAYIVEVEYIRAKMGGQKKLSSVVLRTTSVFRPENGTWKIVHRHADPINTNRSPESVIQK